MRSSKAIPVLTAAALLVAGTGAPAATSLWTVAEVWSGDDALSLTGGVVYGTSLAHVGHTNILETSNSYHEVGGRANGSASHERLDFSLDMYCVFGGFSNQYVAARGGMTNTVAICGPSGTGTVVYSVAELAFDWSTGGLSDMLRTRSLQLTHDGEPVPLHVLMDEGFLRIYTSSAQRVRFGSPFVVGLEAGRRLEIRGTPSTTFSLCGYEGDASYRIWQVCDAAGNTVSNGAGSTWVSEAGTPYPSTPRLKIAEEPSGDAALAWHSIMGRPYRLTSTTNLSWGLWTNLPDTFYGTGTTNLVPLPTGGGPMRFYRLLAPR